MEISDVKRTLEKLSGSPIIGTGYTEITGLLSGAIVTLSGEVSYRLEEIVKEVKNHEGIKYDIEQAHELLYQIRGVAEAIKERAAHPDYVELANLFYYYNKEKGIEQ